MSLDFKLDSIANYMDLCWKLSADGDEQQMNPVTHGLIFATMSVGINKITADNADEFYARLAVIERVQGAFLRIGSEDTYITPQDIHDHIGLWTNANSETRAQWAKRMFVGPVKRDYSDMSITTTWQRVYQRTNFNNEVTA